MEQLFTPESWSGGFHELDLDLGPRSDERLVEALRALWAHPALIGPYPERDREPSVQEIVEPDRGVEGHLYGVATLPSGGRVACGSVAIRYEGDSVPEQDHLTLYVPRGGLEPLWPPYALADEWRRAELALDDWLAGIGRSICERVRVRIGLVGFELDAPDAYAPIESWLDGTAAGPRPFGVLRPTADGVEWHPPEWPSAAAD